uniref:PASTA domain-containing protein n=1 Tax=Herbidospora sakaeratensis TaxID=564415 RepID=UPI0007863940|nr:PASTA domain-containing protein [Herbidospora sakaeratensis]
MGRIGRWAAAAGAVFLLVSGLGLALRLGGLSDAANVAQLMSLLPLAVAAVQWAKTRRETGEGVPFGDFLRGVADASGVTTAQLKERLSQWEATTVDDVLSGRMVPPWEFAADFAAVIGTGDPWQVEVVERRIREAWLAASGDEPQPVAPIDARSLSDVLREVEDTREIVSEIRLSVSRYESINAGMAGVVRRLADDVARLSEEDLRTELRETKAVLAEHRRRLRAAERRLARSEQQRREAELLRDAAVADHLAAMSRLRALDARPSLPAAPAARSTPPPFDDRVLERVDVLLDQEAAALGRIKAEIASVRARRAGRDWRSPRWPAWLAAVLVTVPLLGGSTQEGGPPPETRRAGTSAGLVPVPRVHLVTIDEAAGILSHGDLRYSITNEASATHPAGTVLGTEPPDGTSLRRRSFVVLRVSSGPPTVRVPAVTGRSKEVALAVLRETGLVGRIKRSTAPDRPGRVTRTDPAEGSALPIGSVVTVYLPPALVPVPGVIGLGWQRARDKLRKAGFEVDIDWVTSAAARGVVIRREPAGKTAPPTSTIYLAVSNGPAPSPDTDEIAESECFPGSSGCTVDVPDGDAPSIPFS